MKNLLLTLTVLASPAVLYAGEGKLEELIGATFDMDGATFQVNSGGCTEKKDFEFQLLESRPLQLQVIRLKYDACEAYAPLGEQFHFSYAEMGLKPGSEFVLRNSIKPRILVPAARRVK